MEHAARLARQGRICEEIAGSQQFVENYRSWQHSIHGIIEFEIYSVIIYGLCENYQISSLNVYFNILLGV